MNKALKLWAFSLMVVTLASCATPYQKMGLTGGFSEKEVDSGQYELYYLGNGATSWEQVEVYWHRRASELCAGGYTHIYTDTDSKTSETWVSAGGVYVPVTATYPQVSGVVTCTKTDA